MNTTTAAANKAEAAFGVPIDLTPLDAFGQALLLVACKAYEGDTAQATTAPTRARAALRELGEALAVINGETSETDYIGGYEA